MTPELQALARRAVACKGWRWMPGMLAHREGAHFVRLQGGRPPRLIRQGQEVEALPDLSDPCTLGGLLALVREAWGDPLAHVAPVAGGWRVWLELDLSVFFDGATEAEALVAALEAASL